MTGWVRACLLSDIDEEDLIRWDHDGRVFAIYRTQQGIFATDGLCSHQQQPLDEGIVTGMVIECPLHGGRFDIKSGKALSPPVCVDLKTYAVKVEGEQIFIRP